MKKWGAAFGLALVFAFAAAPLRAQGTQTVTISGTVTSADGQPLAGATVAAKSPSLIGTRTAVTDGNGAYIFKGLPPGLYALTFQSTGMTTIEQTRQVDIGTAETIDATLKVANIEETIVVTAEAPTALTSPTGGAQYANEKVDLLATTRTLQGIAELTPGLTDNTPNAGQLTISGAFAYDNVFLVDGVDVNDNLFGSANNLWIEDAIDEIQVLTSGISAEYGRFSGGIINAVTKRGGNSLSGSFRTDLTNPDWRDEVPFEDTSNTKHDDKLSKIFQATLGGPILRDRLWFFAAGRRESSATPNTLREVGTGYNVEVKNTRFEGKLTGNVDPNHSLQANYMTNDTSQANRPSLDAIYSMDIRTLIDRELPNNLFVASYNGVLRNNLFAELQFSRRFFGFSKAGGDSTDIKDSPFFSSQTGADRHYNAPYFDNADPEERKNRQFAGSLSYFLSTSSIGKHDVKLGFEHFTSARTGGNSQSATGYVFYADFKTDAAGKPVTDANGRFIPVFDAGNDRTRLENWLPVRGAQIDIRTFSIYLNDRWNLNEHLSFNLGARTELVKGQATGGLVTVNPSLVIVPRLAASYDLRGDGVWKIDATFGQYAGKYAETQVADNTNVGNPNYLGFDYIGPTGEGIDFAPGFDPRNYAVDEGNFPVANVSIDPDVKSPLTTEVTFGIGRQIRGGGFVKLLYTRRNTKRFFEDFITIDNSQTPVVQSGLDLGTFDNLVIKNTSEMKREYQGLYLHTNVPLTSRWEFTGHWTYQIRNHGNFEGEGANTPGSYSVFMDYPEFRDKARHYPEGRLDDFQKHKVVAYTTYVQPLGRLGDLAGSLFFRYESPLTYSHTVSSFARTTQQSAKDPGYARPMPTQTLFFGKRGENEFAGHHIFNFALSYSVPVWRTARPWVKLEVRNMLNNDKQIAWDRTITAVRAPAGPVDSLGLPTTFTKGTRYGTATSLAHYPTGRELFVSLGFRF